MSRLLIIDDCDDFRLFLKAELEKKGFEVLDANNAMSGLDITRKYFINLVLTDLYMPELDGIQTIIRFKQEFPGLRIIAMTGACSDGRCESLFGLARERGACDVFKKRDDINLLIVKINEALFNEQKLLV